MTRNSDVRNASETPQLGRSWPVVADAHYKVFAGGDTVTTGTGRTVNLSSTAVLFESERILPVGNRIDLSIAWPAVLNQKLELRLCVTGLIVEMRDNRAAVEIHKYEFRTQPLASAGMPGAPA